MRCPYRITEHSINYRAGCSMPTRGSPVKTRLLAWFWLLALSQAALAQQVRPVDSDSVDAGLKAVRGGSPRRGTHVIAETPYPSRINRLTEENLPAIWRRGRDYSALRASPLRGRPAGVIPASLLRRRPIQSYENLLALWRRGRDCSRLRRSSLRFASGPPSLRAGVSFPPQPTNFRCV